MAQCCSISYCNAYWRSMLKTRSAVRTFPPGGPMQLIDLSREIYHKMPRIMTHPPIIITPFGTHQEIREADGYKFSSATLSLAIGDPPATHPHPPAPLHPT